MKCCGRHSHDLMKQIRRKGMGHLISNDPIVVVEKASKWVSATAAPHEFDPYIVATLEIYKKAEEVIGESVKFLNAAGHVKCPLCEINAHLKSAKADEEWIDNITDLLVITCHTNKIPLRTTH